MAADFTEYGTGVHARAAANAEQNIVEGRIAYRHTSVIQQDQMPLAGVFAVSAGRTDQVRIHGKLLTGG